MNPNDIDDSQNYDDIRVFEFDGFKSIEDSLAFINGREFDRFLKHLPYAFVFILKCYQKSYFENKKGVQKLNLKFRINRPLVFVFEYIDGYRILYKNYGEYIRFQDANWNNSASTNFGRFINSLEKNTDLGYFCGVFKDITLSTPFGKIDNIQKFMDEFGEKEDLLCIRFLKLFVPNCKPNEDSILSILSRDFRNCRMDGFRTIFDFGIEDVGTKAYSPNNIIPHNLYILNSEFRTQRNISENLLLLAVRTKSIQIVQMLLDCGINLNFTSEELKTAADIAFEQRNLNILILLIENNSKYPNMLDNSLRIPYEIQDIISDTNSLHNLITSINEDYFINFNDSYVEQIKNIIRKRPNLQYWYNVSNKSAVAHAIVTKKFKTYNILLQLGLFVGPSEDIKFIKSLLSDNEREEIRQINASSAIPIIDDYLQVLICNSYVWCSKKDKKYQEQIIKDAFVVLSQNDNIKPILEIVAAARNFKIIFDFNSLFIDSLDFTTDRK